MSHSIPFGDLGIGNAPPHKKKSASVQASRMFGKYLTRGFSSEVLVLNRGPCTKSRPNG